jgi:hypothetical protein
VSASEERAAAIAAGWEEGAARIDECQQHRVEERPPAMRAARPRQVLLGWLLLAPLLGWQLLRPRGSGSDG